MSLEHGLWDVQSIDRAAESGLEQPVDPQGGLNVPQFSWEPQKAKGSTFAQAFNLSLCGGSKF